MEVVSSKSKKKVMKGPAKLVDILGTIYRGTVEGVLERGEPVEVEAGNLEFEGEIVTKPKTVIRANPRTGADEENLEFAIKDGETDKRYSVSMPVSKITKAKLYQHQPIESRQSVKIEQSDSGSKQRRSI